MAMDGQRRRYSSMLAAKSVDAIAQTQCRVDGVGRARRNPRARTAHTPTGEEPAGLSDTNKPLVLPLDVVRLERVAHVDRVAVLEHIADQTAHVYR